ncbi:hypothetical protein [Consotaella aegiceratis]|uniref:hypothetical protein n=1 Tax=Consotaella aegiceratis TaxID=3097961 RepID=UPI002F411109
MTIDDDMLIFELETAQDFSTLEPIGGVDGLDHLTRRVFGSGWSFADQGDLREATCGSIDAALKIAERLFPDWSKTVLWNGCQGWLCGLTDDRDDGRSMRSYDSHAATGGLSMLVAILKAVIDTDEREKASAA